MYQGCQSMTTICSAPINCQKCDSFYGMFWNCSSAFMIALDNLKNTHNIKNFSQMFMNCGTDDCQITGSLDLSSATNVDEMFTCFGGSPNSEYTGDPIHLKNVPRSLDLSKISYYDFNKVDTCTEGIHYIIDNYID